ncbi:microtubule-associated serine/threonine-protein kinase 3-like [Ranitomeya variabilis]|uniref:microtubule-associated serine/threonine-protein kinase 3-like n=1 Tax=Ranitomeya variabilis TaxID=490064 RepID=UPI004056F0FC
MRPTSDTYKAPFDDITNEFLDNEILGTPSYMAPEVILKKGYGRPVDWWSIWIILYEFLLGFTPFNGTSKKEIYCSIIRDDITWNYQKYSPPPDAQNLITELLRKNPTHRLGTDGANEIKCHQFLRYLDFENLLSQKSLFVPDLKSDEDTHYFITRHRTCKHIDSDKGDTSGNNDWTEVQNFVSSSQRFSKLYTPNTGMMTNEEPISAPMCSPENSEIHSDVQSESSPKPDSDNQCLTTKSSESSLPSLSDSPVQKR